MKRPPRYNKARDKNIDQTNERVFLIFLATYKSIEKLSKEGINPEKERV